MGEQMEYEVPPYSAYRCETASPDIDDDDLPMHQRYMPLLEFLQVIPQDKNVPDGAFILCDVEGFWREDIFILIYYRTPWNYIGYFPIININLEGRVIDDQKRRAQAEGRSLRSVSNGRAGTMYGKGVLKKFIQHLCREMPSYGFKGIFMEGVFNGHLMDAAIRYGFEAIVDPETGAPTKNLRLNFPVG